MEEFDVIIIGGGPAGYLAAERAGQAGLKTLLAEKRELGGVCLNEGCIPTKTLLYSAKALGYAAEKGGKLGVSCGKAVLDHAAVMKRKQEVVSTLVGGVSQTLRRKGVRVIRAEASIKRENGSFAIKCGGEIYAGKSVLIATGSVPVIPPVNGLAKAVEEGRAITSREMLELKEIPKKLVIVGGGVIGLEMAAYCNAAGSSVTVVEMMDHIGGEIDGEASALLQRILEKKGIGFYLGGRVTDVSNNEAAIETNGQVQKVPYDSLLLSVGRKPMSEIGGLKELGILTEKGAIVTDELCRTNVEGVYAAGDVNGKYMLAHVAYREAEAAINNIAGIRDAVDYSAIPGVIYTDPEVAFTGMTERQAQEKCIKIAVKKASVNMSGRHVAENGLADGFCKLVIDDKKGIILGATIVSSYASEMIYALTLMIQNKIPVDSVKRTVFPHPTVCEVIREAIFSQEEQK
jgi:dihydrolipoamide dehydrogenase